MSGLANLSHNLKNSGLIFNGSSQSGTINLSTVSLTNWSFVCWFRLTSPSAVQRIDLVNVGLLSSYSAPTLFSITIGRTSVGNNIVAQLGLQTASDGLTVINQTVGPPDTLDLVLDYKIYNLVLTYDQTNVKFYWQGQLIEFVPVAPSKIPTTLLSGSSIGTHVTTRYFKGVMGEQRLMPLTLTESQIKKHYNAGKGSDNLDLLSHHYWFKFNELTGTSTAIDSSGNNLNLTLNNYSTTGFTPFLG